MKKTAISLLLAVVMVFSLVLVAAPAAQATTTHTDHCVCNGNAPAAAEHTCAATTTYTALAADKVDTETVKWTLNSERDRCTLEGGTYYLTEDFNISDMVRIKGEVTLCLNGKTLTCRAIRFDKTATLTITDCSAGKTAKLVCSDAHSNTNQFFAQSTESIVATINVWGGTFETHNMAGQGAIFNLGTGGHTLNFYAGTIKGGNLQKDADLFGAAIRLTGGSTLNMYGGTITGGKLTAATGKVAKGGNVYLGGGIFNMYGGTVVGGEIVGTADQAFGGNICIGSGLLNLAGGTVSGGTSTNGADIMVLGGKIKINKADTAVKFTLGADVDASEAVVAGTGIKVTNSGSVYTAAKATAGGNVNTGDSANLVVMGLGLVLGVAGMACLLPKKQKV